MTRFVYELNLQVAGDLVEDIKQTIKDFILKEFLPGEDPSLLTDSVELISGRILDSLATLKLVSFLEEKYKIEFAAHEVGVDHLNTIADITRIVESKMKR